MSEAREMDTRAQAALALNDESPYQSRSVMQMARQRLLRDRLAVCGTVLLLLLVILTLGAPLLSKHVTGFTPEQIELGATLKTP